MNTLINSLILLVVAFTSLVPVYSQKKVEPSELKVVYYHWSNCTRGPNRYDNCIDQMWLTIENNSDSVVRKITIWVEIRNTDGQIIYRRKHNVNLNLDPGEIGATEVFNLHNWVWWFDSKQIYITIISVN